MELSINQSLKTHPLFRSLSVLSAESGLDEILKSVFEKNDYYVSYVERLCDLVLGFDYDPKQKIYIVNEFLFSKGTKNVIPLFGKYFDINIENFQWNDFNVSFNVSIEYEGLDVVLLNTLLVDLLSFLLLFHTDNLVWQYRQFTHLISSITSINISANLITFEEITI